MNKTNLIIGFEEALKVLGVNPNEVEDVLWTKSTDKLLNTVEQYDESDLKSKRATIAAGGLQLVKEADDE